MKVAVVVTPNGTGFLARTGAPLDLAVEGPTPDAAVAALQAQIEAKLQDGSSLQSIRVNEIEMTLAALRKVGESPMYEEWEKEVAEYRRQHNTVPDAD